MVRLYIRELYEYFYKPSSIIVYVDGYKIPKGAAIFSSMRSMHQRSDVYSEPEKFMPERFTSNLKTMSSAANGKLEGRDHFNFGWGR